MRALLFAMAFISIASSAEECSLNYKEHKLVLKKEVCEFPEGNKVPCAQVQAQTKGRPTRKGPIVFRNGSDFNSFCVTAKMVQKLKSKARVISAARDEELKAFLICPAKKNSARIVLNSPEEKKECDLGL